MSIKTQDIARAVESAQMSLIAATVASCTCGAESLSLGLHESHCRTLKLANALDQLDIIAEAITSGIRESK